jgi:hypothetical protein
MNFAGSSVTDQRTTGRTVVLGNVGVISMDSWVGDTCVVGLRLRPLVRR